MSERNFEVPKFHAWNIGIIPKFHDSDISYNTGPPKAPWIHQGVQHWSVDVQIQIHFRVMQGLSEWLLMSVPVQVIKSCGWLHSVVIILRLMLICWHKYGRVCQCQLDPCSPFLTSFHRFTGKKFWIFFFRNIDISGEHWNICFVVNFRWLYPHVNCPHCPVSSEQQIFDCYVCSSQIFCLRILQQETSVCIDNALCTVLNRTNLNTTKKGFFSFSHLVTLRACWILAVLPLSSVHCCHTGPSGTTQIAWSLESGFTTQDIWYKPNFVFHFQSEKHLKCTQRQKVSPLAIVSKLLP